MSVVRTRRQIDRAVAAGVPATWVTADAVYGSDSSFGATAEGHGLSAPDMRYLLFGLMWGSARTPSGWA